MTTACSSTSCEVVGRRGGTPWRTTVRAPRRGPRAGAGGLRRRTRPGAPRLPLGTGRGARGDPRARRDAAWDVRVFRRRRVREEHVALRVADRLAVERLGVLAHRGLPGIGVVRIDPRQLHVHLAQQVLELVHRPPVQRGRRDNVVAGREQREQGCRLCRDPAGERDRAAAALRLGRPAVVRSGGGRYARPRSQLRGRRRA